MRAYHLSGAYGSLVHWRGFRFKLFGEGILVGVFAGGVIAFFRYALEQAETLRNSFYQTASLSFGWVFVWVAVSMGVAQLLYQIVQWVPMASGSGIPQVKGILAGRMRMPWFKVLAAKLVGGIIAIGSGLSLGREGPSIQLGAAVGQGLSRFLGRSHMEERYLLTSGASAGLAAAFNAPLAGVIFSLEELHKNFSPAVLVAAVTASLSATVVSQYFYGEEPVFHFVGLPVFPTHYFGLLLVLGVGVGLLGAGFNRGLLLSGRLYEVQTRITGMWKGVVPLVLAGALALILPEVLGGGNVLVNELAGAHFDISYLWLLLLVKFLFTLLCYASGVPGGIFLPMLVVGALGGAVFSYGFVQLGVMDSFYSMNIIVFAMAACFSAVVKSPVTGSILIMEMSGAFHHMLPLVVVSMAAYLTADLLRIQPIYEVLLERSLRKQGKGIGTDGACKRSIVEVAVGINSLMAGKLVKQIEWPSSCLLFSLKRGEVEMTPNGNTRILPGDFLYVLTETGQSGVLQQMAVDPAAQ